MTSNVRRPKWTADEDEQLRVLVIKYGYGKWAEIAKELKSKHNRDKKSVRSRWVHHLDPTITKRSFTETEDRIIMDSVKMLGHTWAEIAQRLPGRTDGAVKNRWNGHLRKRMKLEHHTGSDVRGMDTASGSDQTFDGVGYEHGRFYSGTAGGRCEQGAVLPLQSSGVFNTEAYDAVVTQEPSLEYLMNAFWEEAGWHAGQTAYEGDARFEPWLVDGMGDGNGGGWDTEQDGKHTARDDLDMGTDENVGLVLKVVGAGGESKCFRGYL